MKTDLGHQHLDMNYEMMVKISLGGLFPSLLISRWFDKLEIDCN